MDFNRPGHALPGPSQRQFEATGYRPDIDGLRAVAVVLVIAFHAFPAQLGGGYIGVDVFFVISGFLITGLILSRINSGGFSLREFYARRARRILPALAVVLVGVLAIGLATLPLDDLERLRRHAIAGAFFVPNFAFWGESGYFDVDAGRKPLLHLWSLGVEEQFYLVWPILLSIIWRRPRWAVPMLSIIVGASLSYSIYATYQHPAAAFYSPLSRLWELGVGGLLATARPNAVPRYGLSIAGLTLIVASAIFLSATSRFPGLLAIPPVAGTAMVIAAGAPFLAGRPLVGLGLISYPLYLWHWPLLSLAVIHGTASPANRILIVCASVLLAWLTFRLIERPVRFGRLRNWGAVAGLSGMAVAAFMSAFLYSGMQLLWHYPTEVRRVLEVARFDFRDRSRFDRCWLEKTFEPFAPECRGRSIVVWGDSHAARLYTGLEASAGEAGRVGQFTRSRCMPILTRADDACAVGNAWVMGEIRRTKPGRVIVFAAWFNYTANENLGPDWPFAGQLAKTLRELRAAGVADVVLIGPSPVFRPFLPEAVFDYWSRNGSLPDRIAPAPRSYGEADALLARIAAGEGARFVSLFSALCKEGGCMTHTPDAAHDLLSWDAGHFTTTGASFVVRHLGLEAPGAQSRGGRQYGDNGALLPYPRP